jgi:hypothetical protein
VQPHYSVRLARIAYNAQVDYVYAAIIFVFIVVVLFVLWKREHPKN